MIRKREGMEAGSQKQQSIFQCEALPIGLSDTHIVQHIQEGFVVTQQEDTRGTARRGWMD